jgi:hypothetical protein
MNRIAAIQRPSERILRRVSPAYQAWSILYVSFIVGPLVAGLDKFFSRLGDWGQYVAPRLAHLVHGRVEPAVQAAGVIEIAVALVVAVSPRIGGVLLAGWLWLAVANLLLLRGYYDVALMLFGLSLGALALARLTQEFD